MNALLAWLKKWKWYILVFLGVIGVGWVAGDTGAVMDDGPWRVKIGTDEIGRVFSTQPTGSPTTLTWEEHFERRDTKWFWVQSGKTWTVTVDQYYDGTLNKAPDLRCGVTTGGVTYLECQKTILTRQGSSGMSPGEHFAGNSGSSQILAYHADGHIDIEAKWTTMGVNYTKQAEYYVKTDPNSNGDNTLRSELVCAESGFRWPARSKPLSGAVTWTMTWDNGTVQSTCPAGYNAHSYLVDLQ